MNILPPFTQNLSVILSATAADYAVQLDGTDLRGTQLPYLLAVCRHPGLSQEALARNLGVDKSNVARQLNELEHLGYLSRERDGTDRRCLVVHPTDRAFELLPRLFDVVGDCRAALFRGMSAEETELLCELIERMARNAERLMARRAHQDSIAGD